MVLFILFFNSLFLSVYVAVDMKYNSDIKIRYMRGGYQKLKKDILIVDPNQITVITPRLRGAPMADKKDIPTVKNLCWLKKVNGDKEWYILLRTKDNKYFVPTMKQLEQIYGKEKEIDPKRKVKRIGAPFYDERYLKKRKIK